MFSFQFGIHLSSIQFGSINPLGTNVFSSIIPHFNLHGVHQSSGNQCFLIHYTSLQFAWCPSILWEPMFSHPLYLTSICMVSINPLGTNVFSSIIPHFNLHGVHQSSGNQCFLIIPHFNLVSINPLGTNVFSSIIPHFNLYGVHQSSGNQCFLIIPHFNLVSINPLGTNVFSSLYLTSIWCPSILWEPMFYLPLGLTSIWCPAILWEPMFSLP